MTRALVRRPAHRHSTTFIDRRTPAGRYLPY